MKVMKWCSAPLLLALAATAQAAPDAKAKAEINGLMQVLAQSQCRFQRNGDWHEPAEARAHLQRKYDYLLKKDQVDNAEQFIQRAASKSSISGKPYRVKCGALEVDAATWFDMQLQRLRSAGAAPR